MGRLQRCAFKPLISKSETKIQPSPLVTAYPVSEAPGQPHIGAKESPEAADPLVRPQLRSRTFCLLEALAVRLKPVILAISCHKSLS
jgi:hypothetical protein